VKRLAHECAMRAIASVWLMHLAVAVLFCPQLSAPYDVDGHIFNILVFSSVIGLNWFALM